MCFEKITRQSAERSILTSAKGRRAFIKISRVGIKNNAQQGKVLGDHLTVGVATTVATGRFSTAPQQHGRLSIPMRGKVPAWSCDTLMGNSSLVGGGSQAWDEPEPENLSQRKSQTATACSS
jgi:hypothetical protein